MNLKGRDVDLGILDRLSDADRLALSRWARVDSESETLGETVHAQIMWDELSSVARIAHAELVHLLVVLYSEMTDLVGGLTPATLMAPEWPGWVFLSRKDIDLMNRLVAAR